MLKKYIKIHLALMFIISNMLSALPAAARWAEYEDIMIEREFYNKDINVNADGTIEEIIETQQKVLKDGGRDIANYTLRYNEHGTKLTIIEAKTIYEGKEYKVSPDNIEDKPLASSPSGFDQYRQVRIEFPNVQIGSKIYLKYKETCTIPAIQNHFGQNLFFAYGEYWRNSKVRISSQLPLYFKINDPKNSLKVIESNKDGIYQLDITLTKPLNNVIIYEPTANTYLNDKYVTWISLSNFKEWSQLAVALAPEYNKVVNQPLPDAWQDIVTKAAAQQNEVDQINTVTSLLNEKVRYMGDWRTVQGQYFPRNLDTIAQSQMGDCKDFTVSTAAILQKLGYQVQPSLVSRGFDNPSMECLPCLRFDHAFLKVTNKDGKVYWIDPTNFSSMADGIYPDIANKMALVLDEHQPKYERVPEIDPAHALWNTQEEVELKGTTVRYTGEILIKGEYVDAFTGAGLNFTPNRLKEDFFYMLSGTYLNPDDIRSLTLSDLNSRIVKDFSAKYSYDHKNSVIKTNLGAGISLDYSWVNKITNVAPEQIRDIRIGFPHTIHYKSTIKGTKVKQCENLNVDFTSPWMDIKRRCSVANNGDTILNDTIVSKKTFISSSEFKSASFKQLKQVLEANFKNAILVTDYLIK